MFDIGFSEMMVIAVIALIVLGPEKLPRVARTAGHLLGRMQRYVNDVKADINREIELEELRKLQKEMQSAAQSLEQTVRSEIDSVQSEFKQVADSTQNALGPMVNAFADASQVTPDAKALAGAEAPSAKQMELGLDTAPLANAPPPVRATKD
jgi:sec-independent protein translocase protein TatB